MRKVLKIKWGVLVLAGLLMSGPVQADVPTYYPPLTEEVRETIKRAANFWSCLIKESLRGYKAYGEALTIEGEQIVLDEARKLMGETTGERERAITEARMCMERMNITKEMVIKDAWVTLRSVERVNYFYSQLPSKYQPRYIEN